MFLRIDVKFLPRVPVHQNLGYTRMLKEGQDIGLYFDEQKVTTIVVHDENHFSMDSGVREIRAQYHPEKKKWAFGERIWFTAKGEPWEATEADKFDADGYRIIEPRNCSKEDFMGCVNFFKRVREFYRSPENESKNIDYIFRQSQQRSR